MAAVPGAAAGRVGRVMVETSEANSAAEAPALPPLYRASVPVFLRVLDRLEASLARAEHELGGLLGEALATRPAEGMFPAAQQIATAVQFTLRVAFPLTGQRAPELRAPLDGPGLRARITAARPLRWSNGRWPGRTCSSPTPPPRCTRSPPPRVTAPARCGSR